METLDLTEPHSLHTKKHCERCGTEFLCAAGSISRCECLTVELHADERKYIAEHYNDCICAQCLRDMKAEHARLYSSSLSTAATTVLVLITVFCAVTTSAQPLATFGAGIDTVVAFRPGTGQNFGQSPAFFPRNVFGLPDTNAREDVPSANPAEICSLGLGGEIIVGFKNALLLDRAGADFTVFENAFVRFDGRVFAEPAKVAVSRDGVRFVEFPFDSLTLRGCAGITPTRGNESPFNPARSGGDAFDLATIQMDSVRFIKITDISAFVLNNPRHPFFDPTITGFDLDAVVGLHLVRLNSRTSVNTRTQEHTANTSLLPTVRYENSHFLLTLPARTHRVMLCTLEGKAVIDEHIVPAESATMLYYATTHLPRGAYFLTIQLDNRYDTSTNPQARSTRHTIPVLLW